MSEVGFEILKYIIITFCLAAWFISGVAGLKQAAAPNEITKIAVPNTANAYNPPVQNQVIILR